MVLEANRDHWNKQRGPRLERVVFRNDLSPEEALDACVSGDGEVDIVTEVSPADAERVRSSKHAELVEYDANRVLVGVVNRYESSGAPLGEKRARQALNLAVDKERLVAEGLGGYANSLCALTPSWCALDDEQAPRESATSAFAFAPVRPGRLVAVIREDLGSDRRGRCSSPVLDLELCGESATHELRFLVVRLVVGVDQGGLEVTVAHPLLQRS